MIHISRAHRKRFDALFRVNGYCGLRDRVRAKKCKRILIDRHFEYKLGFDKQRPSAEIGKLVNKCGWMSCLVRTLGSVQFVDKAKR